MARSPRTVTTSSLSTTLLAIIDPIRAALDSNATRGDEPGAAADMGHQQPSMEDAGLRILLDSIARQIYRQLRGTINSKVGVRYDNIQDRFFKSQEDMAAHADKYRDDMNGMQADPRTYVLSHWFAVNEARYDAYSTILAEVCTAYQDVTGKLWVYVEDQKSATVSSKDMTDDQRKAAIAKFANFKKKEPVIEQRLIKAGAAE